MARLAYSSIAAWLVLLFTCSTALAAANKGADVDFGAHIVEEAVDLSNAHTQQQDADTKDMESLLHWAIEHSDPEQLKEKAQDVRREEAIKEFTERQKRVKELSDVISQQPTESQLMMDDIAVLTDDAASTADKAAALARLQVLVEPIDNANDLKVLGGLTPLVSLLSTDQPEELQEGAAYVLGTAASNNAQLVELLVKEHPELLEQLLQLVGSSQHEGASAKAMYALGVLVRSPVQEMRSRFYQLGGLKRLQRLMAPSSGASLRVKSKGLSLITDLIEMAATGDDTSLETWDEQVMAQFAAAALDMLGQAEELDSKEKALMALRVLLLRRGGAGRAALEEEGGEAVLREALTELDLLVEGLGGFGEVDHQGQAGADSEGEEQHHNAQQEMRVFASYVAGLCADVLHRLSINRVEL